MVDVARQGWIVLTIFALLWASPVVSVTRGELAITSVGKQLTLPTGVTVKQVAADRTISLKGSPIAV